ncbi:MAG: phospholipid/cholesterol/gamma-HCH transport system ATP-binding protein [Flavobacteriales bacterium]|jgi:phospholipid/cholesterol/gamma-HCH transport system ATP-binding protein
MIELKNINKSFFGVHIVKDISQVFERGKINQIIGKSGSGKSVLTKCIVGLHTPESGEILFDGQDMLLMDFKERRELRKQIGMLFQASALFDSMTVEENVSFPLKMFTDMSVEEIRDRANVCLSRVNLENVNHLFPSETSGGMQKRIGIARAIAMKPKYLFADEPNSGLDPMTAIVIDNLLREITYENEMTTIVITHDMNSVMEIGDNIMFIHEGNNAWSGDRKEILNSNNTELNNFVYASEFMRKLKSVLVGG